MSKDLEEGEKALPGNNKQFNSITLLKSLCAAFRGVSARAVFVSFLSGILAVFIFKNDNFALAAEEGGQLSYGDTAGFELELDTVIVLGEEITSERELENPSKFMTVIDVREAPGRVETVSEVLRDTVGVQINSWGGLGSFATASIRGSSASQVQVFLDGVPLNRAATGVTNLEDLPLDNVEYIEVFRGFTPPDFGASGIGGAINLVTRRSMEEGRQASLSYGSFETYKAELAGSGPAGKSRLFVFACYMSSLGDFEYENENGTPLNNKDDFTEERENNDFESYDLTARLARETGGWELAAIGAGHAKDQGLPGLASAQARRARLETDRGNLTVSARNRRLLDGALDLTVGADGLWESQTYDDPEGELGAGGPRKTENRMTAAGARLKTVWRFSGDDGILTGYLEYRGESYLPVEHVPDFDKGSEQSRTVLAAVLSAELTDPTGAWTMQATLRQERYWNRISGDPNFAWSRAAGDNTDTLDLTSPSLGLRCRVSDTLVLKANAGRFYRVPTFYELFGDRGVALGNTDLKPERGENYDLGFTYRGFDSGPVRRPYVEYAYFQSQIDDMIIFFQNSQRTIRATNIGGALIGGHELSFGLGLFDSIGVSGNYTFQSAVDRGDVPFWRDNQLPFRPMHEAFGRVEYGPGGRFRVFAEANYVSGNYWDRSNLFEVEDRRIYNLGATATAYQKNEVVVNVTGEGKNLADERIADVAGYPLPGVSYYLTIQASW
jgi:iron complex outermembrane receptor protein